MDTDLYKSIQDYSINQHISVNASINSLLSKSIEREGSLEQRRFVGLLVNGKKITPSKNLVEVKGIYYRFKIFNNNIIDTSHEFKITDVQDNILLLFDNSL